MGLLDWILGRSSEEREPQPAPQERIVVADIRSWLEPTAIPSSSLAKLWGIYSNDCPLSILNGQVVRYINELVRFAIYLDRLSAPTIMTPELIQIVREPTEREIQRISEEIFALCRSLRGYQALTLRAVRGGVNV